MPVALVGPQAVQAARAAQSGQHVQRGGRVVDIGGQTIAACHPELAERPMQAAHQAAVRRDSEAHASKRSQHPGPLEHDERRGYRHRAVTPLLHGLQVTKRPVSARPHRVVAEPGGGCRRRAAHAALHRLDEPDTVRRTAERLK